MGAVKKHIIRSTVTLLALGCSLIAMAQREERTLTREGNKQFEKEKYADAEVSYKKALEKNSDLTEAVFNLGDAMYKQGRYDDAIKQFELSAKTFTDPNLKAKAYHNLGNCQLEKKEYEKAVDAYKQALKLNPHDTDTKYNLAYANAKLRDKEKQDQQKKDQKKNDKDQQKKDQKDKDKKGGNDKKDDKGQKDKDKGGQGDKDPKKEKKQQGNISKQQAEKLLEALKAEELKAQDKMQKKAAKPVDVKIEKDW